jgi:RNA polymerase sigma-70 factor (ECF subfamily)
MHSTPPTDGDLLRLMMAGSEDAFGALYERWSPSVYRFALHMSGDQHIAEEVTRDTFMTLVRRPSMFDETRGALVSWLLGIARNLTRRALGASPDVESLDEASLNNSAECAAPSDVLSLLTRREMIEAVRQAVVSLPPAYREVVVLCDLQEMDYRDAAVALNCPVGTVRSRLHRARTMLMTKLQARCLA